MAYEDIVAVPDYDLDDRFPLLDLERWEILKNRLVDELDRGGQTLARFATETGVEAGQLEIWLTSPRSFSRYGKRGGENGTWEKSVSLLIAEALERSFAQLDEERQQRKRHPSRVETSVTRAVMEGIASARSMVETVLIDAQPGLGKTEGFREYIARARKAEGFDCPVWLVELDEYSLSHKAILGQVAKQCVGEGRFDDKSEYSLSRAIIDATEGKGGVLIVDEAQHLGDATKIMGIPIINGLRRLVDRGCFGLVLIGNGEIYQRLSPAKFAQLLSRMDAWRVDIAGLGKGKKGQPALTEEDVDGVMAAWGVSGVDERKYCISAVKQPGALRTLVSLFRRSLERFDCIDAVTLSQIRRF